MPELIWRQRTITRSPGDLRHRQHLVQTLTLDMRLPSVAIALSTCSRDPGDQRAGRRSTRCAVALLAPAFMLAACSATPRRAELHELLASNAAPPGVLHAYQHTIDRLGSSPDTTWHHGWFGNVIVRNLGDRHQGLCYHWQREVFAGISQTANAAGWQASGIFVNPDRQDEHHAVVIFDPMVTPAPRLLDDGGAPHALVLDPWLNGGADVYPLDAWLAARPHRHGVSLQDISGEQYGWAMLARQARAARQQSCTLNPSSP